MDRSAGSAGQTAADVATLQTAASLEVLMIQGYTTLLDDPAVASSAAGPFLISFATTAKAQHADHLANVNATAGSLGGQEQHSPDPKYVTVMDKAISLLRRSTPDRAALIAIGLAATLEEVAAQTYAKDAATCPDVPIRQLLSSVAGVEAQHVTTLLIAQSLLTAGQGGLVVPVQDVGALPAGAGKVGCPNPFYATTLAASPQEGAVR